MQDPTQHECGGRIKAYSIARPWAVISSALTQIVRNLLVLAI